MGVTDPAETYFQDGVWAWSATAAAWVQLQADASGYLKATGLTLPPGAATAANQVLLQTAIDMLVDVRHALHTVGIDELDVIVASSALPSGAATAAHQVTQNTALQLIDDLRTALHSVHTDELDVVIDGQTNDVEIVQQAPADLTAALHGYIGAAWQKLPMLWGISSRWAERQSDTNASTGENNVPLTTVPAGEVWVFRHMRALNNTSACTDGVLSAHGGGATLELLRQATITLKENVLWSGEVVLSAGDYVRFTWKGCTAGDDLYLDGWGYKMDIDL